ncbi:MAG: hypothetical protein ACREK9_00665 [Candidatus Rokuibacteriota bacterium]
MSGAIADLFEDEPGEVPLAPGAMLLRGFARAFDGRVLIALRRVGERTPFRHLVTPGGRRMSVATTNCGVVGDLTFRKAT